MCEVDKKGKVETISAVDAYPLYRFVELNKCLVQTCKLRIPDHLDLRNDGVHRDLRDQGPEYRRSSFPPTISPVDMNAKSPLDRIA